MTTSPTALQLKHRYADRFGDPTQVPKEIFIDPDLYRLELERIFMGPYWHPLAHRAELPNPKDFKTTWMGEAPILIVHGEDGVIRAFLNSCAHRGVRLETRTSGSADEFQCPYHRWVYSTGGKLEGAPGRREFPCDFKNSDFGLKTLRTVEMAGLIFVTADPEAPDLDSFLGEAGPAVKEALIDDGQLTLLGYQRAIIHANWKIYNDNDGYHAPLLHTAFRHLNWQGGGGSVGATQPHGHVYFRYEVSPYVDNGFLADPSLLSFEGTDARGRVISLKPLVGITKHLDTINIRFARPLGIDKTEVHYAYFGHVSDTPEHARHRALQASNLLGPSGLVSIEDVSAFERTHQTSGDGWVERFVRDVGKEPDEWTQQEEVANTVWWDHYRLSMGLV